MLLDDNNNRALAQEPGITFSTKDYEGIIPHDNDPMVITLQIFNWNVKRVLIDPESSADILYYQAFEKIGLDEKQLQHSEGPCKILPTSKYMTRIYHFENHIWHKRPYKGY